jgi:hypothetical protein
MKSRLLIPIITAATALGSGVASANATYWAQNGLLLEVSADPRDGSDLVQTNPVHADSLELVALNDNVRLRGLTVRFSDGRTFSQAMQTIRVGDRVRVDLPENCGVIQDVQLDYGRQLVDRTPARLQIIPHTDRASTYAQPSYAQPTYPSYTQSYTYSQPSYVQPQPAPVIVRDHRTWTPSPAYRVQPQPAAVAWSGSIQGSFRF